MKGVDDTVPLVCSNLDIGRRLLFGIDWLRYFDVLSDTESTATGKTQWLGSNEPIQKGVLHWTAR